MQEMEGKYTLKMLTYGMIRSILKKRIMFQSKAKVIYSDNGKFATSISYTK